MFRPFEPEELAFISTLQARRTERRKGATVLVEGTHSAHLYTVLFGLGFRYKLLADGRRQILNYLLPGDLIGLQGSLMGEMQHSVEALSPMLLCVFEREPAAQALPEPSRPCLRHHLDRGARGADARREPAQHRPPHGAGARRLSDRLRRCAGNGGRLQPASRTMELPLTQQHIADTLGLSLCTPTRRIRKLVERKLMRWLRTRLRGGRPRRSDGGGRMGGPVRGPPPACLTEPRANAGRVRREKPIPACAHLMPGAE